MWLAMREGQASKQIVEVTAEELILGRGEDCDLQLHDDNVSRRHASVVLTPEGHVTLTDLGSANGTYVDGQPVKTVRLEGGEQLQLGDAILQVHATEPSDTDATRIGGRPVAPVAAPVRESAIVRAVMQQSGVRRALNRSSPRRLALYGAGLLAISIAAAFVIARMLGPEATADVVAKVAPSTALIEVLGEAGNREATGTGWVVDAAGGLIVTNAHVINQGAAFRVAVGGKPRPAAVHAVSPCDDLAVLRLSDAAGLRELALGSQREVRRGDRVIAVGYPGNASLGDDLTSTEGIVSVPRTSFRESAIDVPAYANVVQTDAAINPGNSGGPLVDADGRLVGVNSAGRTVAPDGRVISGQSYAIGVDRVRELLPQLRSGRSIGWTGIGFGYPTDTVLEEQKLPPGLTVSRIVPGSPAAKAGMGKTSLIVVAVNGKPITNRLESYCEAVRGADPSAPLELGTVSPGSKKVRTVRLAPAVADAS